MSRWWPLRKAAPESTFLDRITWHPGEAHVVTESTLTPAQQAFRDVGMLKAYAAIAPATLTDWQRADYARISAIYGLD